VRYSNDKRTVFAYFISENPILQFVHAQPGSGYPAYPVEASRTSATFPATTPNASIRWEFAPRTDVYFSYSQGFKSGAFNTVGTTPASITTPIQPEHITAYEVGFKTARGPFHLETAAYYYDYRNLQVQAIGADPSTGQLLVTYKNAPTATIWGLEGSGAWTVTPDFNLRAGVAYTHARYGSFPQASVNLPYTNPATGATLITDTVPAGGFPGLNETPGAPLTENFAGKRIARAPDWTANLGGDYTIPISVGKIVASGNVYFSSAYAPTSEAYNPTTGKPYYYDGAYFQANAALDWVRDRYTLGVYVNNLGNVRYAMRSESNPGLGYGKVLSWPRTFGVRINYAY
jgi:iron complex outermembrane receptor protein